MDLEYLELQAADLTQQEKIVVLLVEKVDTPERVKQSNGAFVGLTEDGLPANTILAFVVQSLAEKCEDVVGLNFCEETGYRLVADLSGSRVHSINFCW